MAQGLLIFTCFSRFSFIKIVRRTFSISELTITSSKQLTSGTTMPSFGLGTWRSDKGLVCEAVYHSLANGFGWLIFERFLFLCLERYVHIDAAQVYKNQEEVGEGIKRALDGFSPSHFI